MLASSSMNNATLIRAPQANTVENYRFDHSEIGSFIAGLISAFDRLIGLWISHTGDSTFPYPFGHRALFQGVPSDQKT